MADHSTMCLGKLAPVIDPRTFKLARYLTPSLPAPPTAIDWTNGLVDWGMNLNDVLGDCVCAGIAHVIRGWSQINGTPKILTDDQVLSLYEEIGGYVPGDPSTDRGCVEMGALNYWRTTGCVGDFLSAYAAVSPTNTSEVKSAITLFGNLYLGVALPISAQTQDVWDVPSGGTVGNGLPGSWGGHCVPVLAYDNDGLTCITWGAQKKLTWAFFAAYVDESYALLNNDWLKNDAAPNGFDLATLKADLNAL